MAILSRKKLYMSGHENMLNMDVDVYVYMLLYVLTEHEIINANFSQKPNYRVNTCDLG